MSPPCGLDQERHTYPDPRPMKAMANSFPMQIQVYHGCRAARIHHLSLPVSTELCQMREKGSHPSSKLYAAWPGPSWPPNTKAWHLTWALITHSLHIATCLVPHAKITAKAKNTVPRPKGEGRCYNRLLFSCSVLGRLGSDTGWVLEDLSYAKHGVNNAHSSGAIISHHTHPPRISRSAETATVWMPLAKPLPKQRTRAHLCQALPQAGR